MAKHGGTVSYKQQQVTSLQQFQPGTWSAVVVAAGAAAGVLPQVGEPHDNPSSASASEHCAVLLLRLNAGLRSLPLTLKSVIHSCRLGHKMHWRALHSPV